MNTVSLAIVTLVLGIDVGWQPLDEGGVEYIIQIEPQLLSTLRSGQDIVSDLPPDLQGVRALRVKVGTGRVPRVAGRPDTAVGTEAARQPVAVSQPGTNPGVLNLPPPPLEVQPLNPGVLALPPPPVDNPNWRAAPTPAQQNTAQPNLAQPYTAPPNAVQPSASPPAASDTSRVVPFQASPPIAADPLAAPPRIFTSPTDRVNGNAPNTAAPPPNPRDSYPQVAPNTLPPATAPETATQNIEKVYQLEILNARLPSGVQQIAEEGPELGPVPKSSQRPVPSATNEAPVTETIAASPTDPKPWGWLILTLLALSVSLGLNFFLGWVTWGFRQRYEALLNRFHTARARTA